MGVAVVPVREAHQLEAFIELPFRLYADDPNWVAPLLAEERKRFDPKRNPFFEHAEGQLFLALDRRGEAVGRVSAHIDRLYNEFHGERTGFFGFFECVDDEAVARALLGAAEDWLRARGMTRALGPFGFNTNGLSGLLIEGFDEPPTLLMPYNPPYYAALLERGGYRKAKDLLAFRVELDDEFRRAMGKLVPRLRAIAERARRQGFAARPLDVRAFDREVEKLWTIYNDAWERNWGFAPMTRREFFEEARALRRVVVPELAVLVERGEEPVGFGLALPDVNQALRPLRGRLFPFGIVKLLRGLRRVEGLRLLTLGVRRTYRVKGVDALLYLKLIEGGLRLLERGRPYRWCECSWVLEDNRPIIRAIELGGGKLYKRYRVYEKALR